MIKFSTIALLSITIGVFIETQRESFFLIAGLALGVLIVLWANQIKEKEHGD